MKETGEEGQIRGRKPLPEGQARSVMLRVRVKPAAAEKFESTAQALGVSPSEAHRLALADWVRKHEGA